MFGQAFTDLKPVNIEDVANAPALLNPPSVGEYLSTHVAQAFEDYSTPGRALEEGRIMQAEKDAGQYDASYYAWDPQTQMPRPANAFAMSQEDWKASEWFREGIQYTDAMTPTRARILAENFDLRRHRETIISAGDEAFSLPMRALGFGAMLIGGLPDPINLIPFSGGMRGAKTAVSAALQTGKSAYGAGLLAGMKTGVVEGTLGGAASMGLTMPDLAAKGEDIGFVDVLHGLSMSAALGSLFGATGGALSAYRGVRAHARLNVEMENIRAEITRLDTQMSESNLSELDRQTVRLREEMRQSFENTGISKALLDEGTTLDDAVNANLAILRYQAEYNARHSVNGKTAADYLADVTIRHGDTATPAEGLRQAAILDSADPRIEWRKGTAAVPVEWMEIPLITGDRKPAVKSLDSLYNTTWETKLPGVGKVVIDKFGIGELYANRTDVAYSTFFYIPEIIQRAEWYRREPQLKAIRPKKGEKGEIKIVPRKGHAIHAVTPVRIGGKEHVALLTFKSALGKDKKPYWMYYGHRVVALENDGRGTPGRQAAPPSTQASAIGERSAQDRSLAVHPSSHLPSTSSNYLYDILVSVKEAYAKSGRNALFSRLPDDITALRQDAVEGTSPRGMFSVENGRRVLHLFTKADFSTLVHESWHMFFENMDHMTGNGLADDIMRSDWQKLREWAGLGEGEPLTVEHKELLARAGEAYLRTGKAPRPELEGVFARFAHWLTNLYQNIKGYLGKDLSPEVRSVFDNFFSSPRNELADIMRAGLAPKLKRDLARGMEKALSDLVTGEPVDVGPVLRESEALGRAYDLVLEDPLGGHQDEVLATLEPEDIERVLVHRGPAVEVDGVIKVQGRKLLREKGSRRGYGMVKIIFGHGEGGNKTPNMPPVTREDVVSLPTLLREWNPAERDTSPDGYTTWRIPREDGNNLVFVSRMGLDGPDSRVVSMYIGDPGAHTSTKKTTPNPPSWHTTGDRDTGQAISGFVPGGRGVENTLPPTRPDFNPAPDFRTEGPDAFEPAPPLERNADAGADAEAQRIQAFEENLVNGVEQLRREGALSEEQIRELDAARQETERALQQDELGQSALECLWNVTE